MACQKGGREHLEVDWVLRIPEGAREDEGMCGANRPGVRRASRLIWPGARSGSRICSLCLGSQKVMLVLSHRSLLPALERAHE